MVKALLPVVAVAFFCPSCVPPAKWPTPSGNPEVVVKGSSAKSKVLSRMVDKQWEVKSESDHTLVFERQQLSAGNRVAFALAGDTMGILDGWNIVLIPNANTTRVCLTSTYIVTKDYGKTTGITSQKKGDEFIATLSGL